MFRIETRTQFGDWTDDPTRLGHGCTDEDNRWQTEEEAEAACDNLCAYSAGAWERSSLPVVPIHD